LDLEKSHFIKNWASKKGSFGPKEVLKDVNLIFPKGFYYVILGLSGSGKSQF